MLLAENKQDGLVLFADGKNAQVAAKTFTSCVLTVICRCLFSGEWMLVAIRRALCC